MRYKNLIISRVGDSSLHRNWLQNGGRYDVCLIYDGDKDAAYKGSSKWYLQASGDKFSVVNLAFSEIPDLRLYDYFWIPDDHVILKPDQINHFFALAQQYDLWLCQPSLAGYYNFAYTLPQHGSLLRFVNLVDAVCPCFSNYALQACMGQKAQWYEALDRPRDKIAIIDDIIAVIAKRVESTGAWNFHEVFASIPTKNSKRDPPENFWPPKYARDALSYI